MNSTHTNECTAYGNAEAGFTGDFLSLLMALQSIPNIDCTPVQATWACAEPVYWRGMTYQRGVCPFSHFPCT